MSIIKLSIQFIFIILLPVWAETDIDKYFPAYAVAKYSRGLKNSSCKSQLEEFKLGVDAKVLWSLKVLDASGEPKPGFFYGNNYWLGLRSQCFDLEIKEPLELDQEFLKNNSRYRKKSLEFPPFPLNYFVVKFNHNSTNQYHFRIKNEDIITLGLCLPESCLPEELTEIIKQIFDKRILAISNLYSADFTLLEIYDLKDNHQWLINWRIICICCILIVTVIMAVVGTTCDIIVNQRRQKSKDKKNVIKKILICFSVYTNSKIIFNTKINKDSVASIHGLRFFGMLWIIMIHTVYYSNDYVDNRTTVWRLSQDLPAQILTNGSLSVDTYFCLSGFLVSWLFFSRHKTRENPPVREHKFRWLDYFGLIAKRVIRLTPAYLLIIGIAEINFGWYAETSAFRISEKPQENCPLYWWRNLLYINNLFPWNQACLSWSWYLSNEMQFYIIGTFLLILSDLYFKIAAGALISFLIISMVINCIISSTYAYTTMLDQLWNLMDVVYSPPWMRIGPYLIGIVAGYILTKLKGKLILKRKILCLFWIIGSMCNILTLFGLYGRHLSIATTAIYVAVSRITWAIGISWLLIACQTNNAGFINKLLSFKIWIPLSRLTYCAYLLNPLLINSIYLQSESAIHIDFLPTKTMFLGIAFMTYFCAYIATILLETPYILLLKIFKS
ncbi:nose resistant to fluoxetine protein 6-like isoform X2 [Cotesia glomerata]|uniref:nose resistant to fluoxetine protein 6-like isoform X2 n=1 Tax=Cotesia glomerata TaxID=32391 RepID=UPI001D026D6B|nr:nose resistant to fluoxetine protein 6-like isoform X2 [Cotesia glomerata]